MTEVDLLVPSVKEQAMQGRSAVEIARWVRSELGSDYTFFGFASCFFLAFKVPVEVIRPAEAWCGRGLGGSQSDQEFEELLGPYVRAYRASR